MQQVLQCQTNKIYKYLRILIFEGTIINSPINHIKRQGYSVSTQTTGIDLANHIKIPQKNLVYPRFKEALKKQHKFYCLHPMIRIYIMAISNSRNCHWKILSENSLKILRAKSGVQFRGTRKDRSHGELLRFMGLKVRQVLGRERGTTPRAASSIHSCQYIKKSFVTISKDIDREEHRPPAPCQLSEISVYLLPFLPTYLRPR